MSNYITIKLRRGTQAQWAATNPVLAEGEFGAETDTRKFKIGNGVTAWNSLSYWGSAGGGAADFTDLGDVPASYAGAGSKFVKVKADESGLEFGTLTIAAADLPSGIDAAKIANGTVSNTEFQYLNGVTAPIQNALDFLSANKVPYSGATGDVNLGEYGAQLGNLEFDNTPTNTPTTDGSMFWDSGDGTLQLQMKGGAIQQVGMNQFARVYNDTASAFTKGQVVYISGAQGNRIAAKLAKADSELTSRGTLGFVVESIAAGAEGNIIVSGPLYKLNTNGLTAGNPLYLSAATAGAYTETAPQAPNHLVVLGYVERVDNTVGSIYVKVDNGYELEELHDVDLTESKTTPVDADALLLQDSADSSVWKRLTWANLKATAKAYFDTVYAAIVHTHVIGDVTNLQTTLDGKVDENASITGATKTKITYDAKGLVTAGADAAIADITGLQTALDGKVDENAAIVGATKTKITYDAKGLVTAGADATTADIADSTNRRYVTDAQLTVIGNTSGTNTGDQTITLPGDITGSGTGSFAASIDKTAITGKTTVTAATGDLVLIADASDSNNLKKVTVDTIAALAGGGSISDGDKGDITVSSSGTVWTVDNDAITYAKLQNVSATSRFLGRISSGAGDAEELTGTQATTLLDNFTSSLKGLAPASGGGTTNFLRADGTWAAPAGGGSTGLTILNQDFTQKGPQNSTTETALYSYTLPTDLVAGDALRLDLSGFYKNNSGSTRSIFFYVKLGATTVFSFNPSIGVHSTERPGTMMLNIAIVATNSQKLALTGWSTDLGVVGSTPGYLTTSSASMYNFIGYNTCAEDLTSAKTLQVSVRFQLANADLYWYSQMATLTKLPKP